MARNGKATKTSKAASANNTPRNPARRGAGYQRPGKFDRTPRRVFGRGGN